MSIREEPFKNFRARSSAKLKIKEDKIERGQEAEDQEKRNDEWNPGELQPSSLSWQQPTTWTSSSPSAWREWSSDQTRERTDWQPTADWDLAQIKRVSALDFDHRAHGSHHSYGSEE